MPDIEIIVRKSGSSEGTTADSQEQAEKATGNAPKQKKEGGKPSPEQQAVRVAMINAAKQAINTGVSQFGNITGDYASARAINTVTSAAADIFMLSQGPVGIIAVATKYTMAGVTSYIEQKNRSINEQLIRERAGSIIKKGSRY